MTDTAKKTPARPPRAKTIKGGKGGKGGKKKPKAPPRQTPASRVTLFVESYLATGNGTEAARAAGYTGTDAHLSNQSWRLLRKAETQAALAVRIKELAGEIGAREVQMRLWRAAAFDVGDLLADEAVADWLMPDAKTILTLPDSAHGPDGSKLLRRYVRTVPDLRRAREKGATGQIKSLSFYPDGSVKSISTEDRAAALDRLAKITRLLEPEQDSATTLALALQQAFGPGVRQDGQSRAAEWRANLSNEGG